MFCQPLEESLGVDDTQRQQTILIVDDDQEMAQVLCLCLDRQGFITVTADSGAWA